MLSISNVHLLRFGPRDGSILVARLLAWPWKCRRWSWTPLRDTFAEVIVFGSVFSTLETGLPNLPINCWFDNSPRQMAELVVVGIEPPG